MTQRLSALDTAFLQVEDAENRMQLAGMLLFEGPAPSYDDFRAAVATRLLELPRFRQRLAPSALGLGRPRWVDDAAFDLDYHLSHVALPSPGGQAEVAAHIDQLTTAPLDLRRPVWELGLVEGVGTGFAISLKVHHCMVDGLSIMDIFGALVDPLDLPSSSRKPRPVPPPGKPAGASLVRRVGGTLALFGQAPRSALNHGPSGPTRRTRYATLPLDDLRAVQRAAEVTLNTVVLTIVAGALERYLHRRGEDIEQVHAFVPVNRRTSDERGRLGNQIAMTYPALPVGAMTARERLALVQRASAEAVHGHQPTTTAGLMSALSLAPAPLAGVLNRVMQFRAGLFNLTVTNVPGPPVPVHFLDRQLELILGSTPLTRKHALTVAVLSYAGQLTFSVTTDPRRLPDGTRLVDDLRAAADDLVAAFTSPEN